MDQEDLKFVAEALIALCAPDPDQPCYDEVELDRRALPAIDLDVIWRKLARRQPHDALMRNECQEILKRARLTDYQALIFQLRLEGVSFQDISRREGSTKQCIRQAFVAALAKLRRAMRGYPYLGISDVYCEETRRGWSPV